MYLNTLDVKLIPRTDVKPYNVRINASTLEMMSLILEFKVASGWHISRFLSQKDQDKYVYFKLRCMWRAGYLESFKVYSGSLAGTPVFYMLSKAGLKLLAEQGKYGENELRTYPHAKTLLSWGLFKHEAQVIELASLEAKNKSKNLNILFKGEIASQAHGAMSDKQIEVLTPDYTALYQLGQTEQCVYSEFERTLKSKDAMLRKLDRYVQYLSPEERTNRTLRIIFQTPHMEKGFWMNIVSNKPILLQKLRILTTNLTLLEDYTQFLEPIYLSESTVKLIKDGLLKIDASERTKLFSFL